MKAVYLTAGAAGMYCGSCMHDNSLAKALRHQGVDCLLQPLYTPIRTDDPSIASREVFFGGIQIYLLQKYPSLAWIPAPVRRWLDNPRFLAWATRRSSATDASLLGELAISMLRGEEGRQRVEVERIVAWLRDEIQPDVVLFSNLLIGGCIPAIQREIPNAKIVVILQGDDSFLDHLHPSHRKLAVAELRRLAQHTDAIVVNSIFYGQKMTELLDLPTAKIHVIPLSIDTTPFVNFSAPSDRRPVTIGYLARVAPEKGLHHLVDAFIKLAARPGCEDVRLCVAGWLGEHNHAYKLSIDTLLAETGLTSRYQYLGSPDLAGKLEMLRGIDILCVPTEHEEPKGIFVLESLAAGVPVVQPSSGAFPEIINSTGGGLLVTPNDPSALADGLEQLVKDAELRLRLGQAGRRAVTEIRTVATSAKLLIGIIRSL